jgi:hypothetical protein
MTRSSCPNDGALIPQDARVSAGSEVVTLSGCVWCQELFAFLANSGRDAAGFAKDGGGGWKVFRAFGSVADVRLAETAVAQVNLDTLT